MTYSRKFSVRLTAEEFAAVEAHAKWNKITPSEVIRRLMKIAMNIPASTSKRA